MMLLLRALLLLYPIGYREVFGKEMLTVMEEFLRDRTRAGLLSRMLAAFSEAGGLLAGAVREWEALLTRRHRPAAMQPCATTAADGLPDEVRAAQRRVDQAVSNMVAAIASHQFQEARRFSELETQERDHLRLLRLKYGLDECS